MTKQEAIKEGYTLCGCKGKEWQNLMTISDMEEIDFQDVDLVLAEKTFTQPRIDKSVLTEMIADKVEDDWVECCADDTGQVFNIINKLDLSSTVNVINEALKDVKSYMLTDIKITFK